VIKKKKKRFLLKITGFFLLILLGLAVFSLMIIAKMAKELPDPKQFTERQINQSTKIYDRTGKVMLYEIYGEEKRTIVPFEEIPDYVKQATITIEDQKFYSHEALDWRAIIRALVVNIISGRIVQGGSTITQQLVKNAFLVPERTVSRKIKELILSYWVEKYYSKDEILSLYFNQISYGANAYGIEAASKTYFNKSTRDLNLAESAALAALPKAPSYYSPFGFHKEELEARKNYILEQMLKLGFIDEEESGRAKNTKLDFNKEKVGSIKAPHFIIMVKEYLAGKYGEDILEKGGLKVITTLDWPLQKIAEEIIEEGVKRNAELYDGKNAAMVAQDAKTGQVLALVGSKNYFAEPEPTGCKQGKTCQFEGNFNVAVQGLRQPGSAFKPFAYVTAFQKGYSPETAVFDLPTEFSTYYNICPLININYNNNNSLCFHPKNFNPQFRGPINLRNALAQSINIPSVKVLYLAGIKDSIKTAADFGITTLNDPGRYGLSLVLGGGEIKLIDLVGAYSVFSQEGVRHRQSFILEVKDSKEKVLEKYLDQAVQVINSQYPRLINNILSDIEARSPLFQNSLSLTTFPDRETALKTGTTNDYRDAWAIGYSPSLVVGVWAGNNNNQPMQKYAGSILAAIPIWHAFMAKSLEGQPVEFFNKPESIQQDQPMLNGEYIINNEAHSILYYLNKNDSQFLNWEEPVKIWWQNLPG